MIEDELSTLLASKRWVKRRVDRVEFLDLTTVRRTIAFTVDRRELASSLRPFGGELIPLGWFAPWANAGAVLRDADQRVIPYLTCAESDSLVGKQIKSRLQAMKVESELIELVDQVRLHRNDPGSPGCDCKACTEGERRDGYTELMSDKWGCRAARELLDELCRREETMPLEAGELAQILLAWQANFVLLGCLDALSQKSSWETLQLSFDEELREWEPPWERRKRALKHVGHWCAEANEWRRHISRGGPFEAELDALLPRHAPRRVLAQKRSFWLRKLGRRGFLGLTWHVAWHQASGMDAPSHQIDVILPEELIAVRMRILRRRGEETKATVADQVGSRATIVAPDLKDEVTGRPQPPPPPTLFSLVITQRSAASWYGGMWIALLTGVAILVTALWWLPKGADKSTDAITMLIVAPTLVATLLSVRAASEIAGQLTTTLRALIGAVGVLAAICAIAILAQRGFAPSNGRAHIPRLKELKALWLVAGGLLICIAATLWFGAYRIRRFLKFGQRVSPRAVHDRETGKVLNPDGALRISPPDRWLATGEGELIPWGWLDGPPGQAAGPRSPLIDRCFWETTPPIPVVKWVQGVFEYDYRAPGR